MADKIKKFLVDNKGCPLTPQATKQLLVKFIELMSEVGTVKVEASNITALSPEVLDELQVGDVVQKITGNMKHCYIVTYKGDGAGQGICLTYCAAGYMETVSYDRSGSSWVYNSTDVVDLQGLLNGDIKCGKYLLDVEKSLYEYIGNAPIPETYSGMVLEVNLDTISFGDYHRGTYNKVKSDGVNLVLERLEDNVLVERAGLSYTGLLAFNVPAGKVPTSDGHNGTSWETPASGTALYYHRVIGIYNGESEAYFDVISKDSSAYTSFDFLSNNTEKLIKVGGTTDIPDPQDPTESLTVFIMGCFGYSADIVYFMPSNMSAGLGRLNKSNLQFIADTVTPL